MPLRLTEMSRDDPGAEVQHVTGPASVISQPVHALLRGLVDYAGLFPPAALSMGEAARQYASHLDSREAWMLGRFVVPVGRLDELAAASDALFDDASEPWRLSALIGDAYAEAGQRIREFNSKNRRRFVVDVIECRPVEAGAVAGTVDVLPGEMRIFVELARLDDPHATLEEIAAAGAWAKARTGGMTAEAFPSARQLARFIACAVEVKVPFKATAGLHHPMAGTYPLTYAADAPVGHMFGFLNLFGACVFAQVGASESKLVALLQEGDADAIVLDGDMLTWRDLSANAKQIASTRAVLGISFGSCSFTEPVDGLRALGLL